MSDSENNKDLQSVPKKRGLPKGKTNNPNGRPKGSGNKISGVSIIAAIEKYAGKSYEEQLAQNYAVCVAADDRAMIAKYDQIFLSKVVGDLASIDVTSRGKSIAPAFNFTAAELSDWAKNKPTNED
jgi:hypothetical protein